jgi:hypothetical protein
VVPPLAGDGVHAVHVRQPLVWWKVHNVSFLLQCHSLYSLFFLSLSVSKVKGTVA